MNSIPPHSLRGRARRYAGKKSSALIITLAIVAILTVLLLAFLTRAGMERQIAGASASETKADQIAKTGLDVIVTDFRQEIAAGSTVTANTTANAGWPAIYLPVSADASVPARILTGTAPSAETNNFNLVRRSMTVADFGNSEPSYYSQYGGAFPTNNLASSPNANTLNDPAVDGRSISLARWNKPQLLNDPAHFVAPDWVLVTRNGPKAFTAWDPTVKDATPSNPNYVIGRYAYTVYDEGGLLDANVVGRSSGIPVPPIGKTVAASLADLTQLTNAAPNWTASACVPNQGAVDALVQWRNASTATTAYDASNPTNSSTYFGYVTGTTNSFTQAQPGDEAFLSRQDLINSITSTAPGSLGAAGFTTNALPFLATFTRQVNAPSFYPPLTNFGPKPVNSATVSDSTSRPRMGYGGGGFTIPATDTADLPGSATTNRLADINLDSQNYQGAADMMNPALADVRFPVAGTLPGFPVGGSPNGPTVKAGDPLLRQRFALSRLALLTASNSTVSSGTPTDQSDLIYRYFGLQRTSATYTLPNGSTYSAPWTYNHGGPSGIILTLPELQAAIANGTIAPRDPDFFELLQAAIAVGSLGRDAGNPSSDQDQLLGPSGTGDTDYTKLGTTSVPAVTDESTTLHILQIGANIIDQANPAYDPISISIATSSGASTVYGQEDLPYINKVVHFISRDGIAATTVGGWYLFELWNPYQIQNAPANYPTNFRITADPPNGVASTAYIDLDAYYAVTPPALPSGTQTYHWYSYPAADFTAAGTGTNYIQFAATPTTFSAPALVSPTNTSSLTSPVAANLVNNEALTGGAYSWAGLCVGHVNADGDNALMLSTSEFASFEIRPGTSGADVEIKGGNTTPGFVSFVAQVQTSANGPWETYDIMRDLFQSKNSNPGDHFLQTPFMDYTASPVTSAWFYFKLDPRTDRFSSGTNQDSDTPKGLPPAGPWEIGHTFLWNPAADGNGYSPTLSGWYWPYQISSGFNLAGSASGPNPGSAHFWSLNQNNENNTSPYYYIDPDGVPRRGDDMYASTTGDASAQYGFPMNTTVSAPYVSRPVMLHRPFQSVAELGYVFRDLPWKSLDFFTSRSGDSALLDVFSAYEEPPLVAGKVDLNTRNVPVLAALINGGCIDELKSGNATSTGISPAEALAFANKLVGVSSVTPLHNKSDLVNRVMASLTTDATSATPDTGDNWGNGYTANGSLAQAQQARIKSNRESVLRSLSEATSSRTWNLMIDVIAQSGRYTSTSGSFANFSVEGEKRYWLHVAIDRYTGKIIDEQLEPVYE